MSTYTDSYSPFLVSEVPALASPARRQPGALSVLWTRIHESVASRRDARAFERVIRNAGHGEAHDLLAARRRD